MIARIAVFLVVLTGSAGVMAKGSPLPVPLPIPAPGAPSTLDNLMTAYDGESNAHMRYLAFAKRADAEGYGAVASLFRAAARAEAIHARNHAVVIRAMGGTPKAVVKEPPVKTTAENLKVAVAGEEYERDVMYPKFLSKAKAERNFAAAETLDYAGTAEATHARLFSEALGDLKQWKGPGRTFYVCSVCGYTVKEVTFKKCPSCRTPKEKYEAVK